MNANKTDVIVHLKEKLSEGQVEKLEAAIGGVAGVYEAVVSKIAQHLMVVHYDPKSINSRVILNSVKQQGFRAQLVGM